MHQTTSIKIAFNKKKKSRLNLGTREREKGNE